MKIISFDVATKSLAVSIIDYNYNLESAFKINMYFEEYLKFKKNHKPYNLSENIIKIFTKFCDFLDKMDAELSNMIYINYLDVKDLIPNKKIKDTDIIERTCKLKDYLTSIENKCDISPECQILVEYQMGPNDKSRTISSQILYHFANKAILHLIGPTLKNKVYIKNDKNSTYSSFVAKYTTNYAANKNHAKYIFEKFINIYKYNLDKKIKKKNIDDIADSTIMSVAFAIQNNNFLI